MTLRSIANISVAVSSPTADLSPPSVPTAALGGTSAGQTTPLAPGTTANGPETSAAAPSTTIRTSATPPYPTGSSNAGAYGTGTGVAAGTGIFYTGTGGLVAGTAASAQSAAAASSTAVTSSQGTPTGVTTAGSYPTPAGPGDKTTTIGFASTIVDTSTMLNTLITSYISVEIFPATPTSAGSS